NLLESSFQIGFCFPIFGDVNRGAEEFGQLARILRNRMAYGMEMPDSSVWQDDSVIRLEVCLFRYAEREKVLNFCAVVRMKPVEEVLGARGMVTRIDPEYSTHLGRERDRL